jgi:methylenetetrahydrofolate--tRNA-(uracil-5-)-methyltransferase
MRVPLSRRKRINVNREVWVVGAGLAGCEAAWQLALRGIRVRLFEMRPEKMTPAHRTGLFAELVCSNSLRGAALENAVGLLKEELRRLNSVIMSMADRHRVEAGGALAVDRWRFAEGVTQKITEHPLITVVHEELTAIPPGQPAIIATGPLTSESLADWIRAKTGQAYLYFYDAAAPIVTRESLNEEVVFAASRYGKGEAAYLNCPLNREEYERFWQELKDAECFEGHLPEEKTIFFEGCMPVEVLAARGRDTLRYGPMKPVGITDPKGNRPYAVVQLRPENREGTLYNLVGFQTHLKRGEQERVFRMIPGLEKAEFVRYGMIHRNTYINSPRLLEATLAWRDTPGLFVAGQITGVEGYVESTAAGLVAGVNLARFVQGKDLLVFPQTTAVGALLHYIATAEPEHFQPMNVNFGLFPALTAKVRPKFRRYQALAARALRDLNSFLALNP